MYKGTYEQLPKVNDDTKDNRRKLGLPISKTLVYKDKWKKKETTIETFEIVEEYNVENIEPQERIEKEEGKEKKKKEIKMPYWATLKVYLSNKTYVLIHSDYLSDMQNSSFYKDMAMEETPKKNNNLKNKDKKGIVYIDKLTKGGCVCHFENIRLTNEDNAMIRELHCMFWQKEKVGNMFRYFLFVSFGDFDIEMNLDILIGMVSKYTDDIRVRESGNCKKPYLPYKKYKK